MSNKVRVTVELGTISSSTRGSFFYPSKNDGLIDWYIQPHYYGGLGHATAERLPRFFAGQR